MAPPQTMLGLAFDARAEHLVRLREDLPLPPVGPGEIRVHVTHATVNGHEFTLAQDPLLRFLRWLKRAPGQVRTGLEFAGLVETGGRTFSEGERVMGYVDMVAGWRPHAEFVAIPETMVARAPHDLPLAHAATLPMGALTALEALRTVAGVKPGHRVLIVGATGGVGLMALQVARILGAEVTAAGSEAHHDTLKALGAHHTLPRSPNWAALSSTFDAIFDASSTLWWSQIRHLLSPRGVFVPADPMRNLADVVRARRARWLLVDRGDTAGLDDIRAWVDSGQLQPVAGPVFEVADWEDAVVDAHRRGRLGRTVLQFAADPTTVTQSLQSMESEGPQADHAARP